MTWIKTVRMRDADEKLREAFRFRHLYPPEYAADVPSLSKVASPENGGGISDSHTLLPDALYHAFALYGHLLSPELALSRPQQEMIATVVSVANDCFY
jgi:hypothetical protein